MVNYYGEGVPTNAELENSNNQTKYVVSPEKPKGVVIPKWLCCILLMGVLILAAMAAFGAFLFLQPCSGAPEAFTELETMKAEPVDQRLPNNIEPISYRLYITPYFERKNFTTMGNLTINAIFRHPSDKVQLNVDALQINTDSVRVRHVTENRFVKIVDMGMENDDPIFTIHFITKLKQNSEVEITLSFTGILNTNMQGFYRSSYLDLHNNRKWLASTQFSPTDARKAYPCFDEPSFKSRFTISVHRPSNMISLSNMLMTRTEPSDEFRDWSWDHYDQTPKMSTYLTAFIVSDLKPFQYNETHSFKVYARTEALSQAYYSASIGPQLLSYFEQYFNIKYPLPKLDVVAIPDFGFSAMENWGLITFRESALLFDPQTSTAVDKDNIANILAHELAHQWFGNLVTPKWWDDLWLKEGFATYFQYYGVNHVEPSWNIFDEFIVNELTKAFDQDSLPSSRPLSFNVQNSAQIRQTFDSISYNKGASIIRMVRHILGENIFKKGLHNFLDKNSYGNVAHKDLWSALTHQAHQDGIVQKNETIEMMMTTWTKRAGFPVVTAIADYTLGRVNVSQSRFSYILENTGKENPANWWIPISNTTRATYNFQDTKPYFWLRGELSGSFVLNTNEWWLLNINHTGYFIVNYDEVNWRKLSQSLEMLPQTTRAQLISNAMELSRANLLDYDIPLRMISNLGRYDYGLNYVTLSAAFGKLEFLYRMLSNTPAFGNLDNYIQSTFHLAIRHMSFNESQVDSHTTQKMRQLVLSWACRSTQSQCVNQAQHRYRDMLTHNVNIAPNTRKVVYCTAIREGSEAEWEYALRKYNDSHLVSERETILTALGCSSKGWILSRYLHMMLQNDSMIRKQDGLTVFKAVAQNPVGNQIAYNFLRINWKEIKEYFGDAFNKIGSMIKSVAPLLNSQYQLDEMKQFKEENKHNLGATDQAFDQAIETIRNNVEWMRISYKSVELWLQEEYKTL